MKTLKILFALTVLGAAAVTGFVYSGIYAIAQDEPHWPLTFKLIETLRERSIAWGAKGIAVPELDDAKLISEGAEHYGAMCSGCHLAPGMQNTEIRAGLYPQPPNLAEHRHGASHADADMQAMVARQFWIIKHGIKMTAMPAWGATHNDNAIWGLVAFLQKLPGMTPEEYAALAGGEGSGHSHGAHTRGAAESGDGHSGHSHGQESQGEAAPAEHVDAPGTPTHSHGAPTKDSKQEHPNDHAH